MNNEILFRDLNGAPVSTGDTVIRRSSDPCLEWYENNTAYRVRGYDAARQCAELTNDYSYAECAPSECEKFSPLRDIPDDARYAILGMRTSIENMRASASGFSNSRSTDYYFRHKLGSMIEQFSTQFELALAEACRQS